MEKLPSVAQPWRFRSSNPEQLFLKNIQSGFKDDGIVCVFCPSPDPRQ
jgi:hypothetical protein